MPTMPLPRPQHVSRGHDSFHGQKLAPSPMAGRAIPMIDMVLLALSLTLLTAVFTLGIRI